MREQHPERGARLKRLTKDTVARRFYRHVIRFLLYARRCERSNEMKYLFPPPEKLFLLKIILDLQKKKEVTKIAENLYTSNVNNLLKHWGVEEKGQQAEEAAAGGGLPRGEAPLGACSRSLRRQWKWATGAMDVLC